MLQVNGGGFLLPDEEMRFREILKKHGKAFTVSLQEIGCVDLNFVELMVIIQCSVCHGT